MPLPSLNCPCGAPDGYARCCGPIHAGRTPARTAEALMRSRYTAFVRGDAAYLLRSWHPDTRPPAVDVVGPRWTGLRIVATEAGGARDETGVVEFEARYEEGGRPGTLRERSRFGRVDGRWVYVDGTAVTGG